MRTRSQARRRRQPQVRQTSVESSNLEKPDNPPIVTMADNRTMAQLLEAPTEGYEDAIVIPEITANNFEIKHGLLNLVQNKQFFGNDKEDPHAHIRDPSSWFSELPSTSIHSKIPLNSIDQDSLNSAAGGNFLDKMPRECLKIIESKSKDTMPPANNGSTEDVQPPVVQIQSRNPNPEPNVAPVLLLCYSNS
ncbi:hypothetical protein Tco_1498930 [Tanacetum coccineum]